MQRKKKYRGGNQSEKRRRQKEIGRGKKDTGMRGRQRQEKRGTGERMRRN